MKLDNILQGFRKPFNERKSFSLDKIYFLLNLLGNPQNNFKSIHIAGTNGKGSVSSMLNSVLNEFELKVGIFTSPHLERFTERIKINNREIDENDFLKILNEKILPIIDELDKEKFDLPTEFEVITLITFYYFAQQKVDIAIIEAGLGGRYDATNSLGQVILSIITNISLDHIERLGNDIKSITHHKVGIIKTDTNIVTSDLNSEKDTFFQELKDKNTDISYIHFVDTEKIYSTNIDFNQDIKKKYICNDEKSMFYDKSLNLKLIAKYQKENIALVLKSLELLHNIFYPLKKLKEKDYIDKCILGLEKAHWSGRFELFNINDLNIILDGAHNDGGMKSLTESLKEFPQKIIISIFACNKDKDYINMINYLSDISKTIIITKSHVEIKAKNPDDISKYLISINKDHKIVKDYRQTIDFACKIISDRNYNKNDVLICICGSLYLIGGIREQINTLDGKIIRE
jgi:dihydrofolate synthase/folylpolyglutamate synthase